MGFLENIWNEIVGFFGVNQFLEILKTGEFERLLTYEGIVALILPIIPLLIVLELILGFVYKKPQTRVYKVIFLIYLFNRIAGRFIALGIVAFGFGMLYMQRFGDQTKVFVEEVTEEEVVEEDIPEPVVKLEDNLVETNEGFFFRLSPDIINNIRISLKNTPHEGLKPILEFTPNGQIVLNFE